MAKVYDTATDLITFARGSSGTALRRVGYGDELVTNGGFDTDTSGWAASAATLSVVSNKLRITNSGANYGYAWQSLTTEVGKTYVYSLDYTVGTSSTASMRVGTAQGGSQLGNITLSASGSHSITFTATTTTSYILVLNLSPTDALYTDIDNISVKEVIFDRATDPLVLYNHPDGMPRIEYGSDGSLKGLLIEEQRTNLFPSSNDFTTWAENTTSGATTGLRYIQENAAVGPDGQTSAHKLVESTDYDQQRTYRAFSGMTANTDYTYSVFLKAGERTQAFVKTSSTSGMLVDLSDGTFTVISGSNHDVQPMGNGWYRCSFTVNETGTLVVPWVSIANGSFDSYTGDGTSGIYVYGAQLEEGSFPTSYIPTSGSQSTRSPDIASIPVSAFGYNQTAGTVVVDFDTVGGADIGDDHYVLSGGNTNSRWAYHNTADILKIYDGSAAPVIMSNQDDLPVKHKFAVASDASSVSTASGGSITEANVTSTGNLPALTTAFVLGSSHTDAYQLNGHIKSLKYYPRRLTDAQLQELTA